MKDAGNNSFKNNDYKSAIDLYMRAINTDKISLENKAKCYGNVSHCYLLWQSKFEDALEAGLRSIECSQQGGNYPRAFQRCADAYVKLGQPVLAALALKKGMASCSQADKKQLSEAFNKIE